MIAKISQGTSQKASQGASPIVVFSDLDGTLLDHFDYSHAAAQTTLQRLQRDAIALVLVTSKTSAELVAIRRALRNTHPFAAENGAAIYLPCENFPAPPQAAGKVASNLAGNANINAGNNAGNKNTSKITLHGECFWRHCIGQPRDYWLDILARVATEFRPCYRAFSELGAAGIAELTGLTVEQATLANTRDASEPIQWLGDAKQQVAFAALLDAHGAQVIAGGRFLHIMDKRISKGYALRYLAEEYTRQRDRQAFTIALGDSDNDLPMLREADQAVIIRSPVHGLPEHEELRNPRISQAQGPAGWSETLEILLDEHANAIAPGSAG